MEICRKNYKFTSHFYYLYYYNIDSEIRGSNFILESIYLLIFIDFEIVHVKCSVLWNHV